MYDWQKLMYLLSLKDAQKIRSATNMMIPTEIGISLLKNSIHNDEPSICPGQTKLLS